MSEKSLSFSYLVAFGEALLVTVLWSSSWVIIKFGLKELPPLMFSGLRYLLAAILLLVMIFSQQHYRDHVFTLSRKDWSFIAMYGFIFIFLTQGAMFIALFFLQAITVSLMLNLTTFIVVILSVFLLKEVPPVKQWFFILAGLLGVL
ncbi:MAG: DMT family transporter, partial [Candidatus Odinarchaeota archaeon]